MKNRQPEVTNKQRIRKQISSSEKRLERNPALEKMYKETINQYILQVYPKKLSQNEIRNTSVVINFVPNH